MVEAEAENANPFGWSFLAPLALGSMLNPINSTMISTALVPIAASLHTGVGETGWLVSGLYLTCAVAQPTLGRMVDLFGPRRIYLLSLIFVAVAGVLGLVAHSLAGLLTARILLGIGTSGAYPATMRIFHMRAQRLGLKPPRTAMGVLTMAALSTTAIGPLIGGVLTGAFGWQAIFAINLPLAALTALLILWLIPRDEAATASLSEMLRAVDFPGIALFALSLIGFAGFFMRLNRPMWTLLAIGIVSGALFVAHTRRCAEPFLDLRVLAANKPLAFTYARAGVNSVIVFAIYYGFAQWLQGAAGFSSAAAGLVTLPMSAAAVLSSVTGVRTKGLRVPFAVSIGAMLVGCMSLALIQSATPVWIVAIAMICFGLPLGGFSTATQAAVYLQAPANEIGAAAGLQRTAQYAGAIVGASLLGLIYGEHASDSGLHILAMVMGAMSAILLISVFLDKTIPAVADAPLVDPSLATVKKG